LEPAGSNPASDASVVAYLQQHGIDAAQLQREQPQACAGLDLPLAWLLVEFMQGREGVRQLSSSPAASKYAARLVFLAREVGLPLADIHQRYVQREDLMFKLEGARQLLQFLRGFLSQPQLVQLATNSPAAWSREPPSVKAAKQRLQQQFQLTDSEWAQAIVTQPALLTAAATAAQMAAWLQAPPANLSAAEVRDLFRRDPTLLYWAPSRSARRCSSLTAYAACGRAWWPS
jgi:hypothetical protein